MAPASGIKRYRADVSNGSRLCENSEIQIACRNSVSVSLISEINCTDSLCQEKAIENIFLLVLGFRTFSHSLGQSRRSDCGPITSALPDNRTFSVGVGMSEKCR